MSRATKWAGIPGLLVLLACGCAPENADVAVGTLERDRIELAAESTEPVLEIPVAEGDAVRAGDLLLRQDPERLQLQLEREQAQRRRAEARLLEARNGPRPEAIDRAEARVVAAEAAVHTAEHELAREEALSAQSYGTQNRIDILKGQYDGAVAGLDEARAALAELRAGTRQETIDQLEESLFITGVSVGEIELALRRSEIRAPVAGTVESLPLEIGERPQPGQAVAVLRAAGRTYARVHVPEPLRSRVSTGTAATIRVDGQPRRFEGRVRWIASEAAFTPYYALTQHDRSRLGYLAEIDLVAPESGALPAGVPVEVRFEDPAQAAGGRGGGSAP